MRITAAIRRQRNRDLASITLGPLEGGPHVRVDSWRPALAGPPNTSRPEGADMADRQYELVYILPPDTTDQQVTELHQQVEAVVSRLNGQIEKTENWGRRRLAYQI